MENVAYYYFEGLLPCQKDLEKALVWCNKAIAAGVVERDLLKARILQELGKYDDAIVCLAGITEKEAKEARELEVEIERKKQRQEELKNVLTNYRFSDALVILSSGDINKKYKYNGGESILHIYFHVIFSRIGSKDFLKIIKEEQGWFSSCQLLPEAEKILEFLIENDFSFNIANKKKQFPLDLFKEYKDKCIPSSTTTLAATLHRLNQIENQVISMLDEFSKSLVHGKKYIPNLLLKMSSKTPQKKCIIPDALDNSLFQDDLNLELHERLNLARVYLTTKAKEKITNLILANIGFVISSGDWSKGTHTRKFITLPLNDLTRIILGDSQQAEGTHSEDELIRFLDANITNILTRLEQHIDKKYQTKIYVVILDINSTIEICEHCTIKIRNLQRNYEKNSFMHNLQNELMKKGFVLPNRDLLDLEKWDLIRGYNRTPDTPLLRLIVRASGFSSFSDVKYLSSESAEYVPTSDLPDNYKKNVKKHSLGVLFHLFPKQHVNSEHLEKYNEKTYKTTLDAVVQKGFFRLYLQTGFANSQGKVKTQLKSNLDLAGIEIKDDFVRLDKIQDIKILKAALKKV